MNTFTTSITASLVCILSVSTSFSQKTTSRKKKAKHVIVQPADTTKLLSMSPTTGGIGGGTVVTIVGSGYSSSVPTITFNGTAGNVKFISSDTVQVTTPATSDTLKVTVIVNNAGVSDTVPGTFDYKLPEIYSISPNTSSLSGQDTITITGKYFYGASSVKFGIPSNVPIAGSVKDSVLQVVNPASTAGNFPVQIQVQGLYSDSSNTARFKYKDPLADLTYQLSLTNNTGLSDKYKIYVLGYSTGAFKVLTVDKSTKTGEFSPVSSLSNPDSGYVQSFEIGKDITQIELSNSNPVFGARIYFFVADTTVTYKDSSNRTGNGNLGFYYYNQGASVLQVQNPPQTAYPPFSYIEPTFKTHQGLFIDVSSVDGFFFPMAISAQDSLGNELGRIGQPKGLTGDSIIASYIPFMKNLIKNGEKVNAYLDLEQDAGDGLKVLYNPGLYLGSTCSPLDTVFDASLNQLFTDTTLKMNIWQNGGGATPENECFSVTPDANVVFPGTTNKHGALTFKNPAGTTYHVFNPVGFSVVSYNKFDTVSKRSKIAPITGTIANKVLRFTDPLPVSSGLVIGMYVQGGKGATEGTTIVNKLYTSNNKIDSVGLTFSKDYPVIGTYKFAKAPTHYYNSSGLTAFAGLGLFADGTFRFSDTVSQVIVNGFENQLSTALNRGVAVYNFGQGTQGGIQPKSSSSPGYTTYNWAIETFWYPKGQPQNYFSLFMHTATAGLPSPSRLQVPIFTIPQGSVKSARGTTMGMAYGFAYDENPIFSVPGPQVPSEFSGEFPKGTVKLNLELGPWE